MHTQTHQTHSEVETRLLGEKIAVRFPAPQLVLLHGQLGAGKTALTKGLARGYGLEDPSIVHSPSFSLVNEYPLSSGTIYHIDLYRLDSTRDLYSIGLDEILWSDQIVIIEWAEKLKLQYPPPVRIEITVAEDETRTITIRP